MTARFSWNQRNTRGHRPRLQKAGKRFPVFYDPVVLMNQKNLPGVDHGVAQVVGVHQLAHADIKSLSDLRQSISAPDFVFVGCGGAGSLDTSLC